MRAHDRRLTVVRCCTYQCRLAGALNAVEADKEGRWCFACRHIWIAVGFDAIQDEWDTMRGLVVEYLGHLQEYTALSLGLA